MYSTRADRERDVERIRAVAAGGRLHVEHALHAIDLLLKRRRHRIGDDLRRSARIGRAHHNLRRRDLRELGDRQQREADQPRQCHDDRDRPGKDRAANEKADHE